MRESIGSLILSNIRGILREKNEHKWCKERSIENRTYIECSISGTEVQQLINSKTVEIIRKYFSNRKTVKVTKNGLRITNTAHNKNLWYLLGLSIADGTILNKNSILFSTTQPCILDALFSSSPDLSLSFSRYYVSMITKKVSPVANIVVYWKELASLLWKFKKRQEIDYLINKIKNNNLEEFFAGVIDGDGAPDTDNIRISTDKRDVLFDIISKLFDGEYSYDRNKYMIRIKTGKIRRIINLDLLIDNMFCDKKKRNIYLIKNKRKRFEINFIEEKISKKLNEHDLQVMQSHVILKRFKIRNHNNYKYLFISYNSKNKEKIMMEVELLMNDIRRIFGLDLKDSLKLGKREIVIYNQKVVNFMLSLRDLLSG